MIYDDFIDTFIKYTAAYESPTEFFYWSAVAGIASVIRDNCCLILGDTKIFPNVYVLIIARPAMRKAKPLNSITNFIKHIDNTKVIEGRASIQAVIQRLGEHERKKNGTIIAGASGIICSEEISAMFTEDDSNIPVLTDLYDYKSSYPSALVSRGTIRLQNVVLTLLGASNEELLRPLFTNKAVYGGLLSRCLVVYGDKVRHRNSLMYEEPSKYNPLPLRNMLRKIASLKGTFQITDAAKALYNDWYLGACASLDSTTSVTGVEGRLQTHVLKVAMILTASKRYDLIIDVEEMEQAIFKVLSLYSNYKRFALGGGKSKEAEPTVKVLELLWGSPKHKASRRDILALAWGDLNAETLDSVIRTLSEGGLITIENKKDTDYFQLTETSIKYFQDNLK